MTLTTAIRPPQPAYEEPGDDRVRVLIADYDGLARRRMQNALHEADGVVTLPAAFVRRFAVVVTARNLIGPLDRERDH